MAYPIFEVKIVDIVTGAIVNLKDSYSFRHQNESCKIGIQFLFCCEKSAEARFQLQQVISQASYYGTYRDSTFSR